MAEYEERYEGNGDYYGGGGASPPQHKTSGFDDTVDSRSQHDSHDYERGSSKSRDRERERDRDGDRERDKDREKDRSRDRDRDRDRHHRDHRDRERSDRRERHRSRDDDHERHRSRDHVRHRDYDRDRESRHRHRSRSKGRSSHRSRSRSRSRSKSKRISGFDMAPPVSALMSGVVPGQVTGAIGATPPVPGMFPNMLNPLTTGQFPPISLMPMQAMTQQATRHARRVYVGGLSPNANEQFSVLAEKLTLWHVK